MVALSVESEPARQTKQETKPKIDPKHLRACAEKPQPLLTSFGPVVVRKIGNIGAVFVVTLHPTPANFGGERVEKRHQYIFDSEGVCSRSHFGIRRFYGEKEVELEGCRSVSSLEKALMRNAKVQN